MNKIFFQVSTRIFGEQYQIFRAVRRYKTEHVLWYNFIYNSKVTSKILIKHNIIFCTQKILRKYTHLRKAKMINYSFCHSVLTPISYLLNCESLSQLIKPMLTVRYICPIGNIFLQLLRCVVFLKVSVDFSLCFSLHLVALSLSLDLSASAIFTLNEL